MYSTAETLTLCLLIKIRNSGEKMPYIDLRTATKKA